VEFYPTAIPDVVLIKPRVFGDHRGFFMETWQADTFARAGLKLTFVQDNHSQSFQNTLRGLHYQIRQPQGKLVRVVAGEVFDVAVDLRRQSPTFGQWTGEVLSAENKHMLWIPPGFAHGFYVTGEMADIVYKCTDYYAPDQERTIRWDDPDLAIQWPKDGQRPVVSDKDAKGEWFRDAEVF